jgi:hypothetical protein
MLQRCVASRAGVQQLRQVCWAPPRVGTKHTWRQIFWVPQKLGGTPQFPGIPGIPVPGADFPEFQEFPEIWRRNPEFGVPDTQILRQTLMKLP